MPAISANIRVVDEDEGLGCLEHDVNDLAKHGLSSFFGGGGCDRCEPNARNKGSIPHPQRPGGGSSVQRLPRLKRMIDDFRGRYYRVLDGRKAVQS